MDFQGLNMERVSRLHMNFLQTVFGFAHFEQKFALFKENSFLFYVVVLQAKAFALVNDKDFGDVILGGGPNKLVAPRLVDFANLVSLYFGRYNF
jgi:hypothetical protein